MQRPVVRRSERGGVRSITGSQKEKAKQVAEHCSRTDLVLGVAGVGSKGQRKVKWGKNEFNLGAEPGGGGESSQKRGTSISRY